jgi:Ca-activated chloride channel family protein
MKRTLVLLPLLASLAMSAAARPSDDDDRERHRLAPAKAFDFAGEMVFGATPGGAQDIAFFRDRVAAGEVPHPNVFTPEGLFSEHDLPVRATGGCRQLLCMAGEATEAALIVQPEVRFLAQVGFDTGLDPKTWKRPALNLVAVIDKSGSMSGAPLDLVKASLRQVVSQLRDDDQLAIVLYGDRSHLFLAPTSARHEGVLLASIDAIESAGSTAMEEGLKVGYRVARESRRGFPGTTRVMLFTDERPNVGATDAESFMGMAEAASRDGVGLTTIGVGVQFGAELATRIASVRGGNLFFFPDLGKMQKTFSEELDTMVTELAYDLDMTIAPAAGLRIAGVYGVPGQMLQWTPDGGITLRLSTIFLSRREGAIYVAFAGAGPDVLPSPRMAPGSDIGWAKIGYVPHGGKAETSELVFTLVEREHASVGLARGLLLVDEVTTLKEATAKHHEKNDQETAYQLTHALASLFRQTSDPDLASERTLLARLEATLAKLSGHMGEPTPPQERPGVDPVTGLPRQTP